MYQGTTLEPVDNDRTRDWPLGLLPLEKRNFDSGTVDFEGINGLGFTLDDHSPSWLKPGNKK